MTIRNRTREPVRINSSSDQINSKRDNYDLPLSKIHLGPSAGTPLERKDAPQAGTVADSH